jgi:hypothetical protein
MTKDQILATVRKCARKLKRLPTRDELAKYGVTRALMRKHFSSAYEAYREAGLKGTGHGHSADPRDMLLDWAAVARKLGHLPSSVDYERDGHFCYASLTFRWRRWAEVPRVFLAQAEQDPAFAAWKDVIEMIEARLAYPAIPKEKRPKIFQSRVVYGPVLGLPGVAHEPMDETGVILVFGIMAHRLGFTVLRTQSAFPDCEALREYRPGCWQRVAIEFEFESRNFLRHGHTASDCDIIVCWRHNWDDVPKGLEVIELSKVVRKL